MAKKSETNVKQYALYQIIDGAEVYIGQFTRDVIHNEYGINVKNLKKDIEEHKILRGHYGRYRIKNIDKKVQAENKEKKRIRMIKHVSTLHCASGCRFGG